MSRRRLSDDERVLWRGVTRSVAPLRAPRHEPDEPPAVSPVTKPRRKTAPVPTAAAPAPAVKPAAAPLAPLERKLRQRLARGRHPIDGRLDLHGMTQAQAHGTLLHYLRARQAHGCRVVLVITGKGTRADSAERGVLKRMVPLWLRLPELRAVVVGFESASVRHGGEGALYVRLRRSRTD
jgi:DNA-nicking Smr family endonuclease